MRGIDDMVVGLELVLPVGACWNWAEPGLLGGRGMRFGCGHFSFSVGRFRGVFPPRSHDFTIYGGNAPRGRLNVVRELVRSIISYHLLR